MDLFINLLSFMNQNGSPFKRDRDRAVDTVRYPIINKLIADHTYKKQEDPVRKNQHLPEVLSYLIMKEKFDQIYKRIQRIAYKDDLPSAILENKSIEHNAIRQTTQSKIIHSIDGVSPPQICKIRTSHLHQKRFVPFSYQPLEINTVGESQFASQLRVSNPLVSVQLLKKSRYRRKVLEPVGKSHMSNSIKDYLSVESISIKEVEQSLIGKSKMFKQYHLSNLLCKNPQDQEQTLCQSSVLSSTSSPIKSRPEQIIKRTTKFKPPFELYYYRDFIWKVGFSNEMVVPLLEQYQSKIKFYVGGGNNSNLIKGIMKRRPWFQLTDKIQQAQFAWTQIKVPSYFQTQKKGEVVQIISVAERKRLVDKVNGSKTDLRKKYTIFNQQQIEKWEQYWLKYLDKQRKIKQNMNVRSKILNVNEVPLVKIKSSIRVHNHFCNNFMIGNKKALFKTMSEYYISQSLDVFNHLPLTFHIQNGIEDDEYLKFLQHYYSISKNNKNDSNSIHKFNAWIVKPGQNTNRGNGIIVCLDLNQIKTILKKKEKHNDGSLKTYILQKYIQKPLLYKRRKFDLRHYIMLNCSNGRMKGYWYREGYVRTTSTEYTLKFSSGSIHLTNDAVQKNLPDYGKYEKGNKITYQQLDAYLKKQDSNFDFWKMIYPQMRQVASDAIRASALNIDPDRRVNNFQIFGLDFMIDENYSVWLIEVNTNPCLETTCPVLNKIIPKFIQNTMQICIDPLFPAPLDFTPRYQDYYKNLNEQNNFQLVFDQRMEGACQIGASVLASHPQQQDDVFDDDGQDFGDECL